MRFSHYYTASNDCTPSRATLLTGLYTHQTGCLITGGSTLDPGFPTWGTMLREHGYRTRWFGKWHLTRATAERRCDAIRTRRYGFERYGFAGGTFPSPNGGARPGLAHGPRDRARSSREWYRAREAGGEPWCTTVWFVNPHDIAWWYRWSDRAPGEAQRAPRTSASCRRNFETPEQLRRARQAAAAARAAGHDRGVVRRRPVHRPRSAPALVRASSTST